MKQNLTLNILGEYFSRSSVSRQSCWRLLRRKVTVSKVTVSSCMYLVMTSPNRSAMVSSGLNTTCKASPKIVNKKKKYDLNHNRSDDFYEIM